jgi:hypothetical protein
VQPAATDDPAGLRVYDILCGGAAVGQLKDGTAGAPGAAGALCYMTPSTTVAGFDLICSDGTVLGTVQDGAPGAQGPAGPQGPQGEPGEGGGGPGGSCTIGESADKLYYVINCGAGNTAQIAKAECGGVAYDPATQGCVGNSLFDNELTGVCLTKDDGLRVYVRSEEECYNGKLYSLTSDDLRRCASAPYDSSEEFCGTDNKVYALCLNTAESPTTSKPGTYNPATEFCGETLTNATASPNTWNRAKQTIGVAVQCFDARVKNKPTSTAAIETQYCENDGSFRTLLTCGTEKYNPREKVCATGNKLQDRPAYSVCGGTAAPTTTSFMAIGWAAGTYTYWTSGDATTGGLAGNLATTPTNNVANWNCN